MRKLGYRIIHLIQLIRYFGLVDAIGIFSKIIFSGKSSEIRVNSRRFCNQVCIRKSQSDYDIFLQVFAELQYDMLYYLPFQPKTIIDCGSNVGYSILYFAEQFKGANIVGVEPDPRNFEVLKKNTVGYTNVKLHNSGIWHKLTRLAIKKTDEWSASVEVVESPTGSIHAVSIPHIMQENGWDEVDIIKLDVEGTEKMLFENNPHEWLSRTKCLIIELHDQLQPGTSQNFFREMAKYNWFTYVRGENIFCFRQS
jgi:FkbM family methyltransferase